MIPLNRRRITQPSSRYDYNYVPGMERLAYQQDNQYQLPINVPGPEDRFGANVKLPEYQMPRTAPPQQMPWDYDAAIKEASKKGANRLAYEEAVKAGSPKVKQTKWDALGGVLASMGTTLATGSPERGMALSRSLFQEPQERNDERHYRKLEELGKLASSDDVDIDRKVRNLERMRDDWFKQQELNRANVDQGRAITNDERANDMRRLQMDNIRAEMEERNLETYIDPKTGIKYKKNMQTGVIKEVAKTEYSEAERLDYEEKKAAAQAEGGWPTERKRIQAQSTARSTEAAAEATQRAALQTQKDTAAAARLISRLQAEAAAMSPDDRYKQGKLELIAALSAKPSLMGLLGPKNEVGGDTVQDDTWYDSEETLRDKTQLRAILNKVANKAATPASPNIPGGPSGTSKPDANNPGGYPVESDNMVEVTAPNGEKTKLTPFQAHAFKQKYPTAKIKGVDYK